MPSEHTLGFQLGAAVLAVASPTLQELRPTAAAVLLPMGAPLAIIAEAMCTTSAGPALSSAVVASSLTAPGHLDLPAHDAHGTKCPTDPSHSFGCQKILGGRAHAVVGRRVGTPLAVAAFPFDRLVLVACGCPTLLRSRSHKSCCPEFPGCVANPRPKA